jgi:hypothetical protein
MGYLEIMVQKLDSILMGFLFRFVLFAIGLSQFESLRSQIVRSNIVSDYCFWYYHFYRSHHTFISQPLNTS